VGAGPDQRPWDPDRGTLWRLSVERFLERPWTGIGIDNFRRTYGRQREKPAWNEVLTSHNWYLETLVSVGLLGAVPFFGWLGMLAWDLLARLLAGSATPAQAAVAAGLLSFALHGLIDYFLLFHATALLFWMLVGLWVDQRSREATAAP
jgi:O-antigen ligase